MKIKKLLIMGFLSSLTLHAMEKEPLTTKSKIVERANELSKKDKQQLFPGKFSKKKRLFKRGKKVSITQSDIDTLKSDVRKTSYLLSQAINSSNVPMVRFLLRLGVDPNKPIQSMVVPGTPMASEMTSISDYPLNVALSPTISRSPTIVRLLLQAGADPDEKGGMMRMNAFDIMESYQDTYPEWAEEIGDLLKKKRTVK